jgi:hypothetical protein
MASSCGCAPYHPCAEHAAPHWVEAEARVTRAALDLFSRVLTGQIEAVSGALRDFYLISMREPGLFTAPQLGAFEVRIRDVKGPLGLAPNGSRGIYHPEVHPAARLAWSIMRRMEGHVDDSTQRSLDSSADALWIAAHGEPWWGRPLGEVAP